MYHIVLCSRPQRPCSQQVQRIDTLVVLLQAEDAEAAVKSLEKEVRRLQEEHAARNAGLTSQIAALTAEKAAVERRMAAQVQRSLDAQPPQAILAHIAAPPPRTNGSGCIGNTLVFPKTKYSVADFDVCVRIGNWTRTALQGPSWEGLWLLGSSCTHARQCSEAA